MCLRYLGGSVRWFRHRKDCMPRKRWVLVKWFRRRKDCAPEKPSGSLMPKKHSRSGRRFRHMKDCVPKKR